VWWVSSGCEGGGGFFQKTRAPGWGKWVKVVEGK